MAGVLKNKLAIWGTILGFISGGGLTVVVDNLIKVSDEVQEWIQSKPVKSKPTSEGGIDYEIKYEEKFGKTKAQEIK